MSSCKANTMYLEIYIFSYAAEAVLQILQISVLKTVDHNKNPNLTFQSVLFDMVSQIFSPKRAFIHINELTPTIF